MATSTVRTIHAGARRITRIPIASHHRSLPMNRSSILRLALTLGVGWLVTAQPILERIPMDLRPWAAWVTWDDAHRFCPTPYSDSGKHICFWPSRLTLDVEKGGGRFDVQVVVYAATWVPLPGGGGVWPMDVTLDQKSVPVLERQGVPAIRLEAGNHFIAGTFRWTDSPQRIQIPPEIGLLELTIDGGRIAVPAWDASGQVWLRRDGLAESDEKNFLSVKVYSVLEDGIPLWWRREFELIVSGKSREEDLGNILPEGWKLSALESPIPAAVDDAGRMKVQVRAGRWTVRADAFRLDNPEELRYASGAEPIMAEELVAFRARPEFRVVEVIGPPSIDVSQTTFPQKWRDLPVYRWDTSTTLRLEERMRGMGDQKPAGLTIAREWWLDEDGLGVTFQDRIYGSMQRIWRLDAAEGAELGSVRSDGQGQLITLNPQNDSPGVEIRTRNLSLEATGRMPRMVAFPATGWRSDSEALNVTLHLPPGWRLFALFGADWVRGDWLTAWTLLDLFLLLIFSLTVFRLWGVPAALLAFVAFGLSYHEPGAPRFLWLILLVPLALQRVVPAGWGQRCVDVMKWSALGVLVLFLVPFIAGQVQQAIYPQMEIVKTPRGLFGTSSYSRGAPQSAAAPMESERAEVDVLQAVQAPPARFGRAAGSSVREDYLVGNLAQDSKARIQTGPGVPEWSWRSVSFGWNGPVHASQRVRPVLIPMTVERLISVLRVVLLLGLAGLLLRRRRSMDPREGPKNSQESGKGAKGVKAGMNAALLMAGLMLFSDATPVAQAQDGGFPNKAMLDQLRERLIQVPDAFPNAADIPSVVLTMDGRRLLMDVEIHTAVRTAVPLPGRLPAWSPMTVRVVGDDNNETEIAALRRDDGFLWIVLPAGVHKVRVEGLLAGGTEWEWAYLLRPRSVTIEAPGWLVSGVSAEGVPEQQVFFVPEDRSAEGQASYERQELQTVALVNRNIEFGLVWQVRTEVTRLSPAGKAISLRIPLIAGENVLTANAAVNDGFIDVRLGAQDQSFAWESELTPVNSISLTTRTNDLWVERWQLVASPVWNIGISGLQPFFEADNAHLIPVWQPWPGESVTLAIYRPEAIAGATMTVSRATREIRIGKRQRVSSLNLSVRCSLGQDFLVEIPDDAEITTLTHNGRAIPVRKDGKKVIIPVQPGEQTLFIEWTVDGPLGFREISDEVVLPVASANIDTVMRVSGDRWVLWTSGPRRGPAVRFWVILACSILAALSLSVVRQSPLGRVEWMLLAIGLTQVPLPAGLFVAGWLFLLAWRGSPAVPRLNPIAHNLLQVLIVIMTAGSLGVLVLVVGEGLLGSPEMFIAGNGSNGTMLRWFKDRSAGLLPEAHVYSVSIWWYRFSMLLWALWLAASLIRWLRMGWRNFSSGSIFRKGTRDLKASSPPPLPTDAGANQ